MNNNPELKLDYQTSIISQISDINQTPGAQGIPVEPAQGGNPLPVYDYDEGIRKYTKKIYTDILDVVTSILPEGSEQAEDKNPEELKGYH